MFFFKYSICMSILQEKLVDTNGAGDAFVGGFLAALAKGKDMEVLWRNWLDIGELWFVGGGILEFLVLVGVSWSCDFGWVLWICKFDVTN